MAGCGDKKIYQWDSDTGDLVQVSSEVFSVLWLAARQLPAPCTAFSAPSQGPRFQSSAVLHHTGGKA